MKPGKIIKRVVFFLLPFVLGVVVTFIGGYLYMAWGMREHVFTPRARGDVYKLWDLRAGQTERAIDDIDQNLRLQLHALKRPLLGGSDDEIEPARLSPRRLEVFQEAKAYYERYPIADDGWPLTRGLIDYLAKVPWPEDRRRADAWRAKYQGETPQPAPELGPVQWLGEATTLAEQRGNVMLLAFWGIRCEPCLAELPELQKLHDQYARRGLTVLAIHTQSNPQAAREHVEQQGYSFPVGLAAGKETFSGYLVRGLPCCFLIDRQGRLVQGPSRTLPTSDQIESLLASCDGGQKSQNELPESQPAAAASQPSVPPGGLPELFTRFDVARWKERLAEEEKQWGRNRPLYFSADIRVPESLGLRKNERVQAASLIYLFNQKERIYKDRPDLRRSTHYYARVEEGGKLRAPSPAVMNIVGQDRPIKGRGSGHKLIVYEITWIDNETAGVMVEEYRGMLAASGQEIVVHLYGDHCLIEDFGMSWVS